jgi:uncharacterized protein with ATP-grasp and redox domains
LLLRPEVGFLQLEAQCVSCLLHRGYEEACLATPNPAVRLQVMAELVDILQRTLTRGKGIERIPAYVGTLRELAVQRITGCPDPYAAIKRESNGAALQLLSRLEAFVDTENTAAGKFRRACLVASLGNIIEYGVQGHTVPWENLETLVAQAAADMSIDQRDELFAATQKAHTVLYLTDNAGEIIFDRPLIQALASLGIDVTVAVKGAPVLNDAMLADAEAARLADFAKIITTGGGAVGLLPKWCSTDFLKRFASFDLLIAKGMAHAETVPAFSWSMPVALLLRSKCDPVAHYLGVPKDRNIVKVLRNHKGWLGPLPRSKVAS